MPVCPKCTRRAPATVSMCRCGHAFDPVEETPAAANVSSLYEPEPRKSPPMFVVAAVLGAALIGSLYWSNRSDAPRARVEAPASRPAAPETPQPRHAAPAPARAAEPAVVAEETPSDRIIWYVALGGTGVFIGLIVVGVALQKWRQARWRAEAAREA